MLESRPNLTGDLEKIGQWLYGVHQTKFDVGTKSFTFTDMATEAKTVLSSGSVSLPQDLDRYSPAELSQIVQDTVPAPDDLVVSVGSIALDSFSFDAEDLVGPSLSDSFVSHPVWDLSVLHLEIADRLGAGHVVALYEGYGSEPKMMSLDYAMLIRRIMELAN